MSVELPKIIRVGPWSLWVIRKDSALYKIASDDGRRIVAASDSERGYIALREDSELTTDQLLVDLLHEVIHMVLDAAGVPSDEHNERYIDTVALGLIPVLRENPELVLALTGLEPDETWVEHPC